MTKFAYLFPGQGAQYVGMGKEFYEQFAEAKMVFDEAEEILQHSLANIILNGPDSRLTETKTAQPAIFVTSWAILAVLQRLFGLEPPVATAGLSLGEYTALGASEKISFQKLLPLVQLRGQSMHEACEKEGGTMLVVMGLTDEQVYDMVASINLPQELCCANFNCPGQVVVSGTHFGIQQAEAAAKRLGAKKTLSLQVHGAFHSVLMQEAMDRLEPSIRALPLSESSVPLAMNVSGSFAHAPEQIKENLVSQICSSVLWHRCVLACETASPDYFLEIGCGKTLASLNKRIGAKSPTISIESVQDIATLEKALARG